MPDFTELQELAKQGWTLRDSGNIVRVHDSFERWVNAIADWIQRESADTGLSLEWLSLDRSRLVTANGYDDSPPTWLHFDFVVRQRLSWLGRLPARLSEGETVPEQIQSRALAEGRREIHLDATARAFVDPSRIQELKGLSVATLDFTKLLRLCEELNICFAAQCYLATSMITRSLLDHVPPIFGCKNFGEVANNYGGSKSFRASMKNLEDSSRKIADQHLHCQIRSSEVLPNAKQVDFSHDLDVLLAEVVRFHKNGPSSTQQP